MTRTPPEEMVEADDAELIRRSLDDPEQFAGVFDRYVEQIHRYVARRLGVQAADDIVAETFLTAFRCRASYDHAQPLARPWLYGIATNLIARQRRDEERFLRALARSGAEPPPAGSRLWRAANAGQRGSPALPGAAGQSVLEHLLVAERDLFHARPAAAGPGEPVRQDRLTARVMATNVGQHRRPGIGG
ncbi:RNA polymerase sigma factor [Nonomuraea jabiensis]|uniref:DNA-directed RNA polymerase specialized sigma24 family protein n=1 Tax=Nonomuraea jabiensis TaxID=882448 RepID=A0A7W9GDT6_9ACTN|nr:sigma factor [Nonomuraea jabiensis]MBB5781967.1 DNA-directed RNA polymerase specialized sigma24 family protein [Nonomuraea jabiensis]